MYCIYAFRNVSTLCVSCKFLQSMRSRQNRICSATQMLSKDYASYKIPKVIIWTSYEYAIIPGFTGSSTTLLIVTADKIQFFNFET